MGRRDEAGVQSRMCCEEEADDAMQFGQCYILSLLNATDVLLGMSVALNGACQGE